MRRYLSRLTKFLGGNILLNLLFILLDRGLGLLLGIAIGYAFRIKIKKFVDKFATKLRGAR